RAAMLARDGLLELERVRVLLETTDLAVAKPEHVAELCSYGLACRTMYAAVVAVANCRIARVKHVSWRHSKRVPFRCKALKHSLQDGIRFPIGIASRIDEVLSLTPFDVRVKRR